MILTQVDFDFLRQLVRVESAIVLEPGKEYLVDARLSPLAQATGHHDIGGLARALRIARDPKLTAQVVDAMTTNETSFLRDVAPFDALIESVIPDLIAKRAATRTLNIWSAACSTGQEPYSIAMLMRHHFPELANWSVNILATDLCGDVLAKAKAGRYAQIEANRGLPTELRAKYLTRSGMGWEIKPEIRAMVEFRSMNLARALPPTSTMDVIFVRNVLMYFDVPTKRQVLTSLDFRLACDGYLFLGAAETLVDVHEGFVRTTDDRSCCYMLKPAT